MSLSPLDVVKKYFAHYNAHEYAESEIGTTLGDDIQVVHYNRGFAASGKGEMLGLYTAANEALKDRGFSEQTFTDLGDGRIIAQSTFTGHNLVDSPFGAAGTDYDFKLLTIFTVVDGEIVKYEDYG